MKNILKSSMFILLLLLTACSSGNNFDIEVDKDVLFKKDNTSFTIKVTDEEKQPVEGLEINAEFKMANMDHGTAEATFTEDGEGIYSTSAKLSMAGVWEIVFTINQDGKSSEEVIQYDLQELDGVASINGEWVTNEDIEFYRFINDLHIAINREMDKSRYEGKELEDALAYWDSQQKVLQDQNQLLTQIIRLRAMALLGVEKGHTASEEEVNSALETVRQQYVEHEVAQSMIQVFGEEKFWSIEKKQYELIILSQKVQNDLIQQVKEENPNVNEQEIMYLAQKQYEELLVSQVNSLEIEIF